MARMAGGCMCGAKRFEADIASDKAYLCHCRMCQQAIGNVSVAWVNVPKADVVWTEGVPDAYASSPIAIRGFCATCGTSLTFAFPDGPNMDITVAAFDDPAFFRPEHHFGVESVHREWLDTRTLPEYRADEHAPTVQRWMNSIGQLPE